MVRRVPPRGDIANLCNQALDHFLWPLFTRGFGFPDFGCLLLLGGAFEVQGEQPLQDLLVGQVGGPAVGGGYGGVEFLVGQVQPGGALVVEVGQGALFELGSAIGVAGLQARIADEAG